METGRYHDLRDLPGVERAVEAAKQNPELTRRLFIGFGAAAVLTYLGLNTESNPTQVEAVRINEVPPPIPPTSNAPNVPSTLPPPARPAPPKSQPPKQEAPPPPPGPELVVWNGPEPREHIKKFLHKVPGVEQLNQRHPNNHWADWQEQLEFIQELGKEVHVNPLKYLRQTIDVSRMGVFEAGQPESKKIIQPKLFVVHWTGDSYTGVDHFQGYQMTKRQRQLYFTDKNARTYKLLHDNSYPAHAVSLNKFSQGHEIESGEYDGITTPMYGFKPRHMEEAVMTAVRFCRKNQLPVDETSIISHYAAHLLFVDKAYNLNTGETKTIQKWDPPQELITNLIIPKAQKLNRELGPVLLDELLVA